MKNLLLFIIFALCSTLPAAAQMGEQMHELSIGANAGAALNKVGFTPKVNQKYYTGPLAGVTLRYTSERYLGMYCALQAEVNFAQLGWKEDIFSRSNEKLPDTYARHLSYFEVPLLASLGFGRFYRGAKGYLIAGPQVSYLMVDKEKRSDVWTTIADVPDRMNNVTAQYGLKVQNKFEYGITAGLGCEYSTKIGHFLLEGRYYMGLSNLYNNSKKDPFPKSNNSTIIVKMTYLFDLLH